MAESESKEKTPYVNETLPERYCECWESEDEEEPGDPDCGCGEEREIVDWRWKLPRKSPRWADLFEDGKLVVFHPLFSSGTATVRGNIVLKRNYNYYWEVKMMTHPYGTDVMVGVGTRNIPETVRDYTSCIGNSHDSYGLSYTGAICQNKEVVDDCPGFCKGTIIGVMVDMFRGTLEFYLNREPQGLTFTDLLRHKTLYPVVSSTAALSALRLTYASSWESSLMVNSARMLAASESGMKFLENMPPGLISTMDEHFWLVMLSAGKMEPRPVRKRVRECRRF